MLDNRIQLNQRKCNDMVTIDFLKTHQETIPRLAAIWYEVLGKKWVPDVPVEQVIQCFNEHLSETEMPITFVAFNNTNPVGMCSLRENDGIRQDLIPWLGSLVVDPDYQNEGIGRQLIDATKKKAKGLGFAKLYLFAFDPTLPKYYQRLGWKIIGIDQCKKQQVTMMEIGL